MTAPTPEPAAVLPGNPPTEPNTARLLNNRACLELGTYLHAFETSRLGLDFRSACANYRHWFASGRLFYAAVAEASGRHPPPIHAVLSVFIAERSSCLRLERGEIAEWELQPWNPREPASPPVIYFSTVICPRADFLGVLYESLRRDLLHFRGQHGVRFHSGLAIACSPEGARHMAKNGFLPLLGGKYLGRYDFVAVTSRTARSTFWKSLLSLDSKPTTSVSLEPNGVNHALCSAPGLSAPDRARQACVLLKDSAIPQ